MPELRAEKSISFPFHLWDNINHRNRTIEKSDEGGLKHRYLVGISSGPKIDEHGERMTTNCIKSFMEQANSGDILLYPDVHDIRASEDIGILTRSKIIEDGDWETEYRLYDEFDNIGQVKNEKINDIWKQMNGIQPYKRPRQKGFSIEGYIPEGAIIEAEIESEGKLKKRVIDNVLLTGVCLVPRQAYKTGIANAIYKALGELSPWKSEIIKKAAQSEFTKILEEGENGSAYFRKRWDYLDALEKAIENVMTGAYREEDKRSQLGIIFDEYRNAMIDLIMSSESIFTEEDEEEEGIEPYQAAVNKTEISKSDIFRSLLSDLEKLQKSIGGHYV